MRRPELGLVGIAWRFRLTVWLPGEPHESWKHIVAVQRRLITIFSESPRDQARDRNSQSINGMGVHPRADARSSTVTYCTENKGTPGRTRRV